jgi:hypothetical protein
LWYQVAAKPLLLETNRFSGPVKEISSSPTRPVQHPEHRENRPGAQRVVADQVVRVRLASQVVHDAAGRIEEAAKT